MCRHHPSPPPSPRGQRRVDQKGREAALPTLCFGPDPYPVFVSSRSRSRSLKSYYGSGSGSSFFYHSPCLKFWIIFCITTAELNRTLGRCQMIIALLILSLFYIIRFRIHILNLNPYLDLKNFLVNSLNRSQFNKFSHNLHLFIFCFSVRMPAWLWSTCLLMLQLPGPSSSPRRWLT